MRFASALSCRTELSEAIEEIAAEVSEVLEPDQRDLVIAFATAPLAGSPEPLLGGLRDTFPHAALLASSAHSAIGGGLELEGEAALSLCVGHLPGARAVPFSLPAELPQNPGALAREFASRGIAPEDAGGYLLLLHPLSTGVENLVAQFDELTPFDRRGSDAAAVGGIASGTGDPGDLWIATGPSPLRSGCAGVALLGDVRVDSLVAQGCRPVGTPSFVTRTEGNAILELDGKPPLEVLQEIFVEADPREQRLLQSALFLGLGMTEGSSHYERGDFLVRDVLGVHEETGALVLPSVPAPQSVVQFHVRDAHAAAEDLKLRAAALCARRPAASGALLFSCLGRGRGLYGVPNHDSDLLAQHFPYVPTTGFFCNGEVGPVEGRTFLHTYTSVYALMGARA
ncbi:MAG: hypothetical protein HKP27_13625 [Myxococcales bacterium]|nr:hypothetical protein [Myxococcales bacterium]